MSRIGSCRTAPCQLHTAQRHAAADCATTAATYGRYAAPLAAPIAIGTRERVPDALHTFTAEPGRLPATVSKRNMTTADTIVAVGVYILLGYISDHSEQPVKLPGSSNAFHIADETEHRKERNQ